MQKHSIVLLTLALMGCGSPFSPDLFAGVGAVSASSSEASSSVTSSETASSASSVTASSVASSSTTVSGSGGSGAGGSGAGGMGGQGGAPNCTPLITAGPPPCSEHPDKPLGFACHIAPAMGDCTNTGIGVPNGGGEVYCCVSAP